MRSWAALPIIVAVLAGCIANPTPSDESMTRESGIAPWVVVGTVDSGLNPYHPDFFDGTASVPPGILDESGAPPIPIELSHGGSFEERVRRDASIWSGLRVNQLYWFVGTRLLGISLQQPSDHPLLMDQTGHGTAVSSVVHAVSPQAWVVVVQPDGFPGPNPARPLSAVEMAAEGVGWLARQPWVDVIALSNGFQVDPPGVWESLGYTQHTLEAVRAGKPVVASAGNQPVPTTPSGAHGPPWIVAVGGVESSTHGEQPRASKLVDVVSDYSMNVASSNSDGYHRFSGTSFSAPLVAANFARALLVLRSTLGQAAPACACLVGNLTSRDFREAMNRSAVYWNLTEYDPLNYSSDPVELALFFTAPVLPKPWVQMGWGYVGPDTWRGMVAYLRGEPVPAKPEEAVAYMGEQQALREAYWAAVPFS